MVAPLLSICIPAYNRPAQLIDLLATVDCASEDIEIVICEDFSPSRSDIRQRVADFQATSKFAVRYIENEVNLGFDGNVRELIVQASGIFILYI